MALKLTPETPAGNLSASQCRQLADALLVEDAVLVLGDFSEAGVTGYSRIDSARNRLCQKVYPVCRERGVVGPIRTRLVEGGLEFYQDARGANP